MLKKKLSIKYLNHLLMFHNIFVKAKSILYFQVLVARIGNFKTYSNHLYVPILLYSKKKSVISPRNF